MREREPRHCLSCGKTYTPPRESKFCSGSCRDRYNNARKRNRWTSAGLCTNCGQENPSNRAYCLPCRQHRKATIPPSYVRESHLKNRYGMSVGDYESLFASQKGVCAICGKPNDSSRFKYFAVDHCHTTKKVRGLLCYHCNMVLGWFESKRDSILGYLEKSDV